LFFDNQPLLLCDNLRYRCALSRAYSIRKWAAEFCPKHSQKARQRWTEWTKLNHLGVKKALQLQDERAFEATKRRGFVHEF
jgi:hypothetical protein